MNTTMMDLKPYVPQLSVEERDRRWRATRERMAEKNIDCLIVWGNTISQGLGMTNVKYLTQVGSWHGGIVLFPQEGKVTLFTAPPHMSTPYNGYLAAQDWVQDIRPFSMRRIIQEIKDRGLEHGRLGLVTYGNVVAGNNLTYYDYQAMTTELPEAILTDVSEMVEELRRIKSPEEIAMLGRSGTIARKVVETMIERATPGVRENELYAAMIHTQLIEGGEPNIFILMSSGPIHGDGSLRRRLIHGNDQPLCPSRRKLEEGDLIICEFHVSYGGYLSAVEFSVCVGDPPKELRELHAVAVECLNACVENCRTGVS
ncbi:MAG: M24 family metallopeptidase, partial [Candidatus Binatia bacterium]|nr:M24 family metallopeptidase [Candidatus Binatia bacterium]